jgi:hypothetical protein
VTLPLAAWPARELPARAFQAAELCTWLAFPAQFLLVKAALRVFQECRAACVLGMPPCVCFRNAAPAPYVYENVEAPPSVDWREAGVVGPIKDQHHYPNGSFSAVRGPVHLHLSRTALCQDCTRTSREISLPYWTSQLDVVWLPPLAARAGPDNGVS